MENVYTLTIFGEFLYPNNFPTIFCSNCKTVVGKFRMNFENKTNALIKEEML